MTQAESARVKACCQLAGSEYRRRSVNLNALYGVLRRGWTILQLRQFCVGVNKNVLSQRRQNSEARSRISEDSSLLLASE